MAFSTPSCVTGNHPSDTGCQLYHPIMSPIHLYRIYHMPITLTSAYSMLRETNVVALSTTPQQETASLRPGLGGKGLPYNLAFLFLVNFREGGRGVRYLSQILTPCRRACQALCAPAQHTQQLCRALTSLQEFISLQEVSSRLTV